MRKDILPAYLNNEDKRLIAKPLQGLRNYLLQLSKIRHLPRIEYIIIYI